MRELFSKKELKSAEPDHEAEYNSMHDWLKKNYSEILEEYKSIRRGFYRIPKKTNRKRGRS